MKPEPLTKKKIIKMKDPYGHFNIEMLKEMKKKVVLAKDVKSAVEWLLKEIEKKKEKLNNFLESRPKNLKGKEYLEWVGDWFQAYNLIEILSRFEDLIKKAFSGVLEE